VRDRDDEDMIGLDSVEQPIRESMHQKPAEAPRESMAELWVVGEHMSRTADLGDEVDAEAGRVSVVESCRREELRFLPDGR